MGSIVTDSKGELCKQRVDHTIGKSRAVFVRNDHSRPCSTIGALINLVLSRLDFSLVIDFSKGRIGQVRMYLYLEYGQWSPMAGP
jgi:hypothetical protein